MKQKLFTVEDRFYISERNGTVVASDSQPNSPTFKIEDELVLVRPDGTKIITEVGGIEMPRTVSGVRKIAILIKNVSKKDIPVGTEVFLKT